MAKKHTNAKQKTSKKTRLIIFCLIIVVIMVVGIFFKPQPSKTFGGNIDVAVVKNQELSIHFLELGNKYTGDCTLIKVGNVEVLIDAGSKTSSIPTIKNYLDQYVTDGTIEYVIVTHAHEDHYAGFATSEKEESLFDMFKVETVIQFACVGEKTKQNKIYQDYQRELAELQERCGTKVYTALECVEEQNDAKREYNLNDNIKLEILDQKYYRETSSTENNHSVCCQIIQNNEKYYIFTGDLEKAGEESLVALNQNRLHQVELYKAGHHGSKTSSNDKLLGVIKPKNICVCCCAGSTEYNAAPENRFPTQDFIDRVAPYTTEIYVTTLCLDFSNGTYESMNGNIVVCCNRDDEVVTIYCSNNDTKLKDTDWFKNNRKLPANAAA